MKKTHRIDHLDDGDVVYIALDPIGIWARSEFPHPLITVDYDEADNVIGISPVGPRVATTLRAYEEWLRDDAASPQDLVAKLGASDGR